MDRLIDSYAEGLIEKAEFEPRITGLRQRIESWQAQIDTMRDEAARQATLSLIIGRLEDFAKRVQDRMGDVDWRMRRDLIRVLVKRVEIHQEDVNVVFRIDPIPPMPEPGSSDDKGCGEKTLHPEPEHQDGCLSGHFLQDCRRRDDTALGRAHPTVTSATHAPHLVAVPLFHRLLEPQPDQVQHVPVDDAASDRSEEIVMRIVS